MLKRHNLLVLDVQRYAEVVNLGTECEKLSIAILDVVSEAHDFALQRCEVFLPDLDVVLRVPHFGSQPGQFGISRLDVARYGDNVLLELGYLRRLMETVWDEEARGWWKVAGAIAQSGGYVFKGRHDGGGNLLSVIALAINKVTLMAESKRLEIYLA